ncbi:hypothetical protein, partial [Anaerobacterium chartisolvens]|uniref:hypothetical protein n=1 Tax=Anaerobacterium chartisolvens TaxID=1297424 RepID=UPI001A9A4A2A
VLNLFLTIFGITKCYPVPVTLSMVAFTLTAHQRLHIPKICNQDNKAFLLLRLRQQGLPNTLWGVFNLSDENVTNEYILW